MYRERLGVLRATLSEEEDEYLNEDEEEGAEGGKEEAADSGAWAGVCGVVVVEGGACVGELWTGLQAVQALICCASNQMMHAACTRQHTSQLQTDS